jgi:hypothetical protein
MGNKGNGGIAALKAQAKKIQNSGESGGVDTGGGARGGSESITLTIRLVKLDLSSIAKANKGDFVDVEWNGTYYDVLLSSTKLGAVPSNYNEQLMQPTSHKGCIKEVAQQPPTVVITVTLHS